MVGIGIGIGNLLQSEGRKALYVGPNPKQNGSLNSLLGFSIKPNKDPFCSFFGSLEELYETRPLMHSSCSSTVALSISTHFDVFRAAAVGQVMVLEAAVPASRRLAFANVRQGLLGTSRPAGRW